jgi:hypothetical protein
MNRETLPDWPNQAGLTAEDIELNHMMSSVGGDSTEMFPFNDYNPSLRYLPNSDIAAFTQFDLGESGYPFNSTIGTSAIFSWYSELLGQMLTFPLRW